MASGWDTFMQNLGDPFGGQAKKAGAANINTGMGTMGAGGTQIAGGYDTAGKAAQGAAGIAGKGAGQFAQEAGQAGQALGEQMGQTAATQGAQQATQAARTAGVNKGQAAMLGGQQAGNLYTQGQQAGQGMGMNAYGQGANTQLGGVNAQTAASGAQTQAGAATGQIGAQQGALGLGQQNAGQQQGKDTWSGIGNAVGSVMKFLGKGGVATSPSVVGEAGPEVVLPLTDPKRMAEILRKIGLDKGAKEVEEQCPTCGGPMKKEAKKEEAKVNA
jgi:hypothetical protein